MADTHKIDGLLVRWGDRLFYPPNRLVRDRPQPRLPGVSTGDRASWIRDRIEALAVRRAPQVMVKVTGGGRGMKAIAAHFRYISKRGRLDIEDEQGRSMRGNGEVQAIIDEWRCGGSRIHDVSDRREAFNIMLSMPRGAAEPAIVQTAARRFAEAELDGHKYVMVLHDHQANPHVHISVRAESSRGRRLNPRKADLQRWRETFAEKLRELGVDAEATRQASRGVTRNYDAIWKKKARSAGRLNVDRSGEKQGATAVGNRQEAEEAWRQIAAALGSSPDAEDRRLGAHCVDAAKNCLSAVERLVGANDRHITRAAGVDRARLTR